MEPKEVCSGSCEKRSHCLWWKLEMISDEMARKPSLEEGKQFKLPGMFESVMQEDKMALEFSAKEWILRGISHLDEVLALLVFGYLLWTQQWVIINNMQKIDRTRQDCFWNLGKVPLWLKCDILPTTREGNRGLHSLEMYVIWCNED